MPDEMTIRQPRSDADFAAMWRLNHDIFALELGQHKTRPDGMLVDKFHDKNIYYLAMEGGEAAGMISAHWTPPYSFQEKFQIDPAALCPNLRLCEVRLLCVRPRHRKTSLAARLVAAMVRDLADRPVDIVLISGVDAQKPLYEHMGFRVVGPPRRDGSAVFHPMLALRRDILKNLDSAMKFQDEKA